MTNSKEYVDDGGIGGVEWCPGNRLRILLTHLESEAFEKLRIESGINSARYAAQLDGNPTPTPNDLKEYYQFLLDFYKRRQIIGKELYLYGDNYNEIRNNLAEHIACCSKGCSERYEEFLDMKFRGAMRSMRKKRPKQYAKLTPQQKEQIRDRIDRKYLGIFSTI